MGRPPAVPVTSTAGSRIGIEQEYAVLRADRVVDFRTVSESVIGAARTERARLQPALPAGAVVAADEHEVEVALPPISTRPGFAERLDRDSAGARAWLVSALEEVLGDGVELTGTSTHVSIELDEARGERVAASMAISFAPALVLLVDRPGSGGIMTRSHPESVEVCGDFAAGPLLRALALFTLAAVLATVDALDDDERARLPALALSAGRASTAPRPPGASHWTRGDGLRRDGRATPVRTSDGRLTTIGDHLVRSWHVARPTLVGHADEAELAVVDRLVDGREQLPVDRAMGALVPSPRGRAVDD